MANSLANASASPAPADQAAPAAPAIPSPFAEVVAGKIPAVSLPPIDGPNMDAAQDFVSKNLDVLLQAGLDYHDTKEGHSILFNPKVVDLKTIEKAEKDGTLDKIVVPAVPPAAPQEESAAPAEAAGAAAGALAGVTVAPPPSNKLQNARIQNSRPTPINTPNSPLSQIGKRAV